MDKNKVVEHFKAFPVSTKTKDLKLRRKLKETNKIIKKNAQDLEDQTLLLDSKEDAYLIPEGLERTWKFTQEKLKDSLDVQTREKQFNLALGFGPYALSYTRNGNSLLLAGKRGHLANFQWKQKNLVSELNVQELIHDGVWLHNENMYATCQKKYSYIYDQNGVELHCLKDFIENLVLDFLPWHFLLVGVGNAGYLKYLDTSTGRLVSEHRTKLGKCSTMAQNPYNAIMNLGHANGTVTLWSPSMSEPLVKMLCHRGPVRSLSVDPTGTYLATSGLDGQLKLWDIRTYKELDSYYTPTPASNITFSQKGLLAVGDGPRVTIWKDLHRGKQKEPYMQSLFPGTHVNQVRFCPFEDVLGVSHDKGFESIIVPGSGEPNFDTMEANPYQTVKQRQESEVHSLLNKIQPEMITLDPTFVGTVDRVDPKLVKYEKELEESSKEKAKFVPVKKKRGKSSSQRRYLRKQGNVVDGKREELKERLKKEKLKRYEDRLKREGKFVEDNSALNRFNV